MRVEVVLPGVLAADAGGARQVLVEVAQAQPGAEPRLRDVLDSLADSYPALGRRLRDETGTVRRHVNLFVDGDDIRAAAGQDTRVREGSTVLVLPNVAGG